MTARDLLRQVRRMAREKYAWPGGYSLALVMTDGAVLCPDCVRSEYRQISHETRHGMSGGWAAAAVDCAANWEESETCEHCSKLIQ